MFPFSALITGVSWQRQYLCFFLLLAEAQRLGLTTQDRGGDGVLAPGSLSRMEASWNTCFLFRNILSSPVPGPSRESALSLSPGGGLMMREACGRPTTEPRWFPAADLASSACGSADVTVRGTELGAAEPPGGQLEPWIRLGRLLQRWNHTLERSQIVA